VGTVRDRLLVTGADGHVGRLLVRHYLDATDRALLLWTRARDPRSALARMAGAVAPADLATGRVRLAGGDLRQVNPFASVDPDEVGAVVHLAAATSFNVGAAEADAVNREGTARVLALARRCPRLRSVCLAGTVYASGLRSGDVRESAWDRPHGFANEYERSKWEAETVALAAPPDVPLSIVRLATVVADDASGATSVHNAVHNTLNLLRHGLLSLMPGDADNPVYLITGALAVQALAAAVNTSADGFFHAAHRAEDSLTLGAALEVAFEVFAADESFTGRRISRPRFADLTSFELLAEGAGFFGGGILGEALASLLPFSRQLYVAKQVENDRLRRLLPGYRAEDPGELLRATCTALLRPREVARVPA
jgi:nucleoside-diphosphate-sugar epimerase